MSPANTFPSPSSRKNTRRFPVSRYRVKPSSPASLWREATEREAVLGSDGMEDEVVERLTLRGAIDALPERERKVIFLRFYKNLTQDRVSRVLGVSQVQVSRIERKAMERLRSILSE